MMTLEDKTRFLDIVQILKIELDMDLELDASPAEILARAIELKTHCREDSVELKLRINHVKELLCPRHKAL